MNCYLIFWYNKNKRLGENNAGKTSLIQRYINGNFDDFGYTTCPSCSTKKINYDKKNFCFDLWDTSANERYRALTKIFISNANIIVLVYNITNKQSFLELDYWVDTVLEGLGPEVCFILVGNKNDLYENEVITEEDGKKYARIIKAKFINTSAKVDHCKWNNFLENALKDYIYSRKNNKKSK